MPFAKINGTCLHLLVPPLHTTAFSVFLIHMYFERKAPYAIISFRGWDLFSRYYGTGIDGCIFCVIAIAQRLEGLSFFLYFVFKTYSVEGTPPHTMFHLSM